MASETELLPGVAVTTPDGQVVDAAGVGATTRPVGKLSTNAAVSVAAVALLLLRPIVRVLSTLAATLLGENALATVGVIAPPFGTVKVSGTLTTGVLVALLVTQRLPV